MPGTTIGTISFENLDVNNNGRIEQGSGTAASTRSSGWIGIGTTG